MKSTTIPTAPMLHDLCGKDYGQLRSFVGCVTEMAARDFDAGRKRMRSGKEICDHLCASYRKGHVKMASHLYSHVHWSLSAAQSEAEGAAVPEKP